MVTAVVYSGFDVVREVGVKRLAARPHARGSGSNSQRFRRKAAAIKHEPFQIGFYDPCSAVPQPPAEAGDDSLEQHPLARKPSGLNETLNGRLDMPHPHGNVPPVENMFYIAADSISGELDRGPGSLSTDDPASIQRPTARNAYGWVATPLH